MAHDRNWKPATYPSLSPYLVVSSVQKVIDFAQAVFDATELRRFVRPDGAILHVEVRIDDAVLMLRDAAEGYPPSERTKGVHRPRLAARRRGWRSPGRARAPLHRDRR